MKTFKLLCIRFSAIGDVAMAAPVIKAFAQANPCVELTMVSRPFAAAFYEGLAENVIFLPIDLKNNRFKGIIGLERLYRELKTLEPDMVCDLHDVLRTKYLRMRFTMGGTPVASIDKHREGKRMLTRKTGKLKVQQPSSFDNYAEALQGVAALFNKKFCAGKGVAQPPLITDFMARMDRSVPVLSCNDIPEPLQPVLCDASQRIIGIAPFAAHAGKIYPVEQMGEVIAKLIFDFPDLKIMLFGGGKAEKEVFDKWSETFEGVVFASELCHGMRQELAVMQRLKCMVSMDSGNMHMASLVGTPVVSVWGATHPLAGFMGWQQSEANVVQLDMDCRPCSIYGNKPCLRGDYACLNNIQIGQIVERIRAFLA